MNQGEQNLPRHRIWGVAALMNAIGDSLAARFATVAVRGELSGLTRAASGHCYFTVKDEQGNAALRCVMFRRAASALVSWPRDGQVVEATGRLGVYEVRGELQLVVEALQTAGAGTLYERFLRLKARLEAEGLFEAARKRPVARWPRAVGVVTSTSGAALHDVLTTLNRRAPHLAVVIYPCSVQGAEAPAQIVAALQAAARRGEVDTVILCRGGGSLEDLWAFNDESVVRAVAASPIPVVCGVGHETDVTLADFAADLRAPTPTGAAELVAQSGAEAMAALERLAQLMARRTQRAVEAHQQRVDRAGLRLARPARVLEPQRHLLAVLGQRMTHAPRLLLTQGAERGAARAQRLQRAARGGLAEQGARLAALEQRLRALDPARVLERGYAWLSDGEGQPLTSVDAIAPGAAFTARLADGRIDATVTGRQRDAVAPSRTGAAAAPKSKD